MTSRLLISLSVLLIARAESVRAARARRRFFQQRRAALHFQQRSRRAGADGNGIEDLSERRKIEEAGKVVEAATAATKPTTAKPAEPTATVPARPKTAGQKRPAAEARSETAAGSTSRIPSSRNRISKSSPTRKRTKNKNSSEQKKDSGDKPKDEKQDQQQGQPVKAGEMTPEEAKRLLDAQKGNEQLLRLKPEDKKVASAPRLVRDW